MYIANDDFQFEVVSTHVPFWQRFQQGRWEKQTLNILDRYLDRASVYVDVGAWIGPTVLVASRLCKQIHAIEPNPVTFDILQQNVELNGCGNVNLYNCAISNQDAWAQLYCPHKQAGDSVSSLVSQYAESTKVLCKKFSTFISEEHINKIDFIKIDIEGAEALILPDMQLFLQQHRPILLVEIHHRLLSKKQIDQIVKVLSMYKTKRMVYKRTLCEFNEQKVASLKTSSVLALC